MKTQRAKAQLGLLNIRSVHGCGFMWGLRVKRIAKRSQLDVSSKSFLPILLYAVNSLCGFEGGGGGGGELFAWLSMKEC